jgi:hypothetical protein
MGWIYCPYSECSSSFSRHKDARSHAENHDRVNQEQGKLNIYACEVCNTFFVEINNLNRHQQGIHAFLEAVKKTCSNWPLIAILYNGSYKTIHFDGDVTKGYMSMDCTTNKYRYLETKLSMSSFYSRVVILESLKSVGSYLAVFKHYKSKELNGELTWTSEEVGSKFTVTSLRENCTRCKLYFNSALAFLKHMKTLEHAERQVTVSYFGGGSCAPGEDSSLNVLRRMFDFEIENSIISSQNDVSDVDLDESYDSSQNEIDDHFNSNYNNFEFGFNHDLDRSSMVWIIRL